MGKSDEKRKQRTRGSFPVGKVSFLDVNPMSFTEFVHAVDNPLRLKVLEDEDWNLIDSLHGDFEMLLRKYLFVGGMPEAVSVFSETGDYVDVRRIQREILAAYDADFVKHAPLELLGKIRLLWRNIPAQLAKENRKFIYSALKSGARAREYETALEWLDDAGMLHQVFRVSPPRLPLFSYQDFSAFKLYMHDVGLLGAMSGLDSQTLLDDNTLFTNFRGFLTEQYVLQELVASGIAPYYWTSDSGNAEVEFVVQGDSATFPIEAKAGINTKAKSLKVYRELFNPPYAIRTSLHPHNNGEKTKDVPLYAIGVYLKLLLNGKP
jgi:predicted AAA+ superfamily ATPase